MNTYSTLAQYQGGNVTAKTMNIAIKLIEMS